MWRRSSPWPGWWDGCGRPPPTESRTSRHDGDLRSLPGGAGQCRQARQPDRPAAARRRRGARLRVGAGRRRSGHHRRGDTARRARRLPAAHGGRPLPRRPVRPGRRCPCAGVPRPGSPVRGARPGDRGARRAYRGGGRVPGRRAHQRRGRDQGGLPGRAAGADPRPPEPHRALAAGRAPAAGRLSTAVHRPHRPLLAPVARAGRRCRRSRSRGRWSRGRGRGRRCRRARRRAGRGRLRRAARPALRDAGRDPGAPHARRRLGRHVHRARGHRRAPSGRGGARYLAGEQPGGRAGPTRARPRGGGRRGQGGGGPDGIAAGRAAARDRAVIGGDLRAQAEHWIAGDPDERDRAELRGLLDDGGEAAAAELADRFGARLEFGTAGLRGAIGAGPNRMNRAVVRAATAALARWLAEHGGPDAAQSGVVIGCDARHRSGEFADEAARVLAGAGIRSHLLPPQRPTPLLAFSVRHLRAAAGIMITASHNPPADNGYKLYLGDGAQIIPPVDKQIGAAIAALGDLSEVPVAPAGSPLIGRLGDEVARAYLDAIVAAVPGPGGSPGLRVVYTPLHGVARGLALRAFERAGFPAPEVVAAQAEPDPAFPTVAFPNPEEPGALDLALDLARQTGADLVVANDPDGDRLAIAVPDRAATGGWRPLTGDQVGGLLGAYLLEASPGPDPDTRLVATTVVSSTMLSKIAAAAGVRYAETLTGFKWIVRAADGVPGARFVFGYEEALGYAVTTALRDKDGMSAALALLSLAAK